MGLGVLEGRQVLELLLDPFLPDVPCGVQSEPFEQASAKGSVTGPSYSHNAGRAW